MKNKSIEWKSVHSLNIKIKLMSGTLHTSAPFTWDIKLKYMHTKHQICNLQRLQMSCNLPN